MRHDDRVTKVLADHPRLREALRDGDHWRDEDGTIVFSAEVADDPEIRSGMAAFAEALGLELVELSTDVPSAPDPDRPPLRLDGPPRSGT